MSARAIWKANLRLGDLDVPVKLYAALTDRKIHFRLLHRKDVVPVAQQMVNPRTDQPVPAEQIKRGIEIEPGRTIVVEETELRALDPPASRDITLERFVGADRIQRAWIDRPYYLGPDGSTPSYFALATALRLETKVGLARWTMRKKRYAGLLGTRGGYLTLTTLRPAAALIDAVVARPATGRDLEPRERKMARQLVGLLEGDFDPSDCHDAYRERVRDLVARKARGEVIAFKKAPASKGNDVSFDEMLARSIRRVKEQRKRA